jgi:hypothetical protein
MPATTNGGHTPAYTAENEPCEVVKGELYLSSVLGLEDCEKLQGLNVGTIIQVSVCV